MKEELRSIQSLLSRQTTLTLATADESAQPRSTPLFFITDGEMRLYWFSSRNSLHSRNCARDPRASIAVFRPARTWRQIQGVQMDGLVAVVADRTRRSSIAHAYCGRFALGDEFASTIRRSALYCFTPAWLRYLDNSHSFGYKFELRLGDDSEKPGR